VACAGPGRNGQMGSLESGRVWGARMVAGSYSGPEQYLRIPSQCGVSGRVIETARSLNGLCSLRTWFGSRCNSATTTSDSPAFTAPLDRVAQFAIAAGVVGETLTAGAGRTLEELSLLGKRPDFQAEYVGTGGTFREDFAAFSFLISPGKRFVEETPVIPWTFGGGRVEDRNGV
jgi:hypothetical protein